LPVATPGIFKPAIGGIDRDDDVAHPVDPDVLPIDALRIHLTGPAPSAIHH
jgi:hypothetical protein